MARRKGKGRSYSTRTYRSTRRVRSVRNNTYRNTYFPSPTPRRNNFTAYTQISKSFTNYQPTITISSTRRNVKAPTKTHNFYSPQARVLHNVSDQALICAKRKQRKNVMHALKHTGKSGQRKPTNNKYRNTQC